MKTTSPILVTGSHRCGSTFLGRMLSIPSQIAFVEEAMNIKYGVEGVSEWVPYVTKNSKKSEQYSKILSDILSFRAQYKEFNDERYVELIQGQINNRKFQNEEQRQRMIALFTKMMDSSNSAQYYSQPSKPTVFEHIFRKCFKSKQNFSYQIHRHNPMIKRILLKDVSAALMSEWMHQEFGVQTVVLIRHPMAIIGSMKRVNWHFDLRVFLSQKSLVQDYSRFMPSGNIDKLTEVERNAYIWNIIYGVLSDYLNRNPKMIAIRHEDICQQPIETIRDLYDRLDLPYSSKVEKSIQKYTNNNNPISPPGNKFIYLRRNSNAILNMWKQYLTEKDINTIKSITGGLASQWYDL